MKTLMLALSLGALLVGELRPTCNGANARRGAGTGASGLQPPAISDPHEPQREKRPAAGCSSTKPAWPTVASLNNCD